MPLPPVLPVTDPGPGPTRRGFLGTLLALFAGTPLVAGSVAAATTGRPPSPTPSSPPAAAPRTPPSREEAPRLLNKVYVAGWQHHAGPELPGPPITPGEPVTLIAEPENPHDPFAVRLELRGQKVGYIPRTENHHLSRLLRAGSQVSAHVLAASSSDPAAPPWRAVRVAVCLKC